MKLVMLKPGHRRRGNLLWPYELKDGMQRVPLSEAQGTVVLALLGRPYLTRMDMAELAWPHPDDMPDIWLPMLQVRICRLNRKLARFRRRIVWRAPLYRLEETVPERIAA